MLDLLANLCKLLFESTVRRLKKLLFFLQSLIGRVWLIRLGVERLDQVRVAAADAVLLLVHLLVELDARGHVGRSQALAGYVLIRVNTAVNLLDMSADWLSRGESRFLKHAILRWQSDFHTLFHVESFYRYTIFADLLLLVLDAVDALLAGGDGVVRLLRVVVL